MLGSIGMPELIIVFVVVLLLFGPSSLPKLGRSIGSALREFKDASNKVSESLSDIEREDARRQKESRAVESAPAAPAAAEARTPANAEPR